MTAGLLLAIVFSTSHAHAQVTLDRLYPPAVAVGGETTIAAEGKFPTWPVQIHCDRDDLKVVAEKDSGKLRVTVAAQSPPGVAWIRLHDKTSASKLVPLLVETAEPLVEKEPNNQIDQATSAPLPSVSVGRLEKSGDVDSYRITVHSGQTLVVSAAAHQILRSPMDAVLQLVDARGNVLVQSDDARGRDPQIVYSCQQDTDLIIRIFAFPETPNSTIGFAGSKTFVYSLNITTDAIVDHCLPLLVAEQGTVASRPFGWNLPAKLEVQRAAATMVSPASAYVANLPRWQWQTSLPGKWNHVFDSAGDSPSTTDLPCVFSGHISRPNEADRLRFRVTKGKKYRAAVHSRQFGFNVDSVLRILDVSNGTELARNDDPSRGKYDAMLDYTAKADGEVQLEISDLLEAFGPRQAYSVTIQEIQPTATLSLAADHFVVKAGETLEIPVTISRRDGFNQKIGLTPRNLPNGVRAEAVVSEVKGDTAKSVKLKLSADKTSSFQGTFQIAGQPLDSDGNPTGQAITATHAVRELVSIQDIWLTVSPP